MRATCGWSVLVKLYAISDLHLGYPVNRTALETIPPHPEDWLALCGDVGETAGHLEHAIQILEKRFRRLLWVPGNHELWTLDDDPSGLRGEAKYMHLVALCRRYGVLTPEDPFPEWPVPGAPHLLCPLFLLYDYTFGPEGASADEALTWARDAGLECADELFLHPDPHTTRQAWCQIRLALTAQRLAEGAKTHRLVLMNHFPLRRDLAFLPRIPRFVVWCGTARTHDWHTQFHADVVVSGHLHIRSTTWIDGVRFEEVSLGYPPQWQQRRGIAHYLREILPGKSMPAPHRVFL